MNGVPAEVAGREPVVVTAADARYGELVRGVNARYVGSPEAVYLVNSTTQVAEVVQAAVTRGKRLTVRSGGHCLEDFVFNPDVQVVLDLSEMNRVYFDAARGAFAVEPGATLIDVYELLDTAWGVAIPAGSFYSVGAGGHVAGGGFGFLSRMHGLAVDHLHAVEVVVVDAAGAVRTVVASREHDDPHRDLWWAHTGGGGGNFGVVTRYWFRSPGAVGQDPRSVLPRRPTDMLLSTVSLPWPEMTRQRFGRLLENFGAFHEKHKDPDSPYLAVTGGLVLTHRSGGPIRLDTQVDGGHPEADRLLEAYLAEILEGLGPVVRPRARRVPWLALVRQHARANSAQNDPTLRGDFKSALMRAGPPDHQINTFYRHLTRVDIDNPTITVSLAGFGGRINAVRPEATAFAHRDCSLALLWTVLWHDPADDGRYVDWNREFYGAVYAETGGVPVPNSVTDGCYINDPDADVADPRFNRSVTPWHELYYKDNYPGLRAAKARWDPRNVFRHRLSVQLP
ncbi:FAD-binding oxidoreductase [Plantactinospora sp. BB1]|uniref:FAD-binding oxidoreductase n=1 Tax=Plantactinospora sp. BB1 TaxID=2071627 RepID=UPI000D1756B9|nr:FAD-binding protein [Plantactinospora sp. BB1]AVT38614.1 FAD-linked oxidase [Plantactinospora sp. BB1]